MYKRIVPCLDTLHGKLVKGVNFMNIMEVGDPAEFAERYERQGADELVLLDIGATPEGKATMLDAVKRVAERISVPLAAGGGIRSVEDARAILEAGASKVSVNTAAVRNPELIRDLSREFGSKRVVSAIDGKRVGGNKWGVYINGGRNPTGIDMIEWARRVKSLGAGEVLYTGVDTDGTREGYDLDGTRAIAEATGLPVIASGGAGRLEHFRDALTVGKADGALAASLFHFCIYTVDEVKRYLRGQGIPVKL